MNIENPFHYEAANTLSPATLVKYYIDDFNFSRLVKSRRNVFLVGDRGSGKTMTLLYNSWPVQKILIDLDRRDPSLSMIGVYIPCQTALMYKPEHKLLDDFQARVISEHFLGLYMAHCFVSTLEKISDVLMGANEDLLREEVQYIMGGTLATNLPFFRAIKAFLQTELRNTQRTLNSEDPKAFYPDSFSFASVFYPLVSLCSEAIPRLEDSHYLLLIDDAHVLNPDQSRALNTWIAFRDYSHFSFKVAVPEVESHPKRTSVGSSILEGHDYLRLDLQGADYSKHSRFYNLARRLIKKRLKNSNIGVTPEEFFPMSPAMEAGLKASREVVTQDAYQKYGHSDDEAANKRRGDYIYKYTRSHYFRTRDPKANLPEYSGFEMLVFLSTGVIRNLVEPCYWMFDQVLSTQRDSPLVSEAISHIPPRVQRDIILDRSKRKWAWLENEIAHDIDGCSGEVGRQAYHLMNNLAEYFRQRLLHHRSEPRALAFTVSGDHDELISELAPVLGVLRKAQLLYLREGPAKDRGYREAYFVPNRILWPVRGLDPQGQHARASIPVEVLWKAANGQRIVSTLGHRKRELTDKRQGGLFDADR